MTASEQVQALEERIEELEKRIEEIEDTFCEKCEGTGEIQYSCGIIDECPFCHGRGSI